MAPRDRTDVEIGFSSGGVVTCSLDSGEAGELEHAYRSGGARIVTLAAEDGPLVLDLARVAYVRSLERRRRIGFVG
jgi:hypothetical protein